MMLQLIMKVDFLKFYGTEVGIDYNMLNDPLDDLSTPQGPIAITLASVV